MTAPSVIMIANSFWWKGGIFQVSVPSVQDKRDRAHLVQAPMAVVRCEHRGLSGPELCCCYSGFVGVGWLVVFSPGDGP